MEHFAKHEAIERKEAEREAKFQGVSVEEILKAQEINDQDPNPDRSQAPFKPVQRVPPPEKQDPHVKFKNAQSEGARKGEWGTGEGGYKPPTEAGDMMRSVRSFPFLDDAERFLAEKIYRIRLGFCFMMIQSSLAELIPLMQYKFRRNWGDF